jgi:hypothetical protein
MILVSYGEPCFFSSCLLGRFSIDKNIFLRLIYSWKEDYEKQRPIFKLSSKRTRQVIFYVKVNIIVIKPSLFLEG